MCHNALDESLFDVPGQPELYLVHITLIHHESMTTHRDLSRYISLSELSILVDNLTTTITSRVI